MEVVVSGFQGIETETSGFIDFIKTRTPLFEKSKEFFKKRRSLSNFEKKGCFIIIKISKRCFLMKLWKKGVGCRRHPHTNRLQSGH